MSRQRFSLHSLYAVCFSDELDAYIVVSFVNATLVLSIGDTVEEVMDSGFVGTTPTLSASAVGDDALLQVRELATFWFSFFGAHCLLASPPSSICLVCIFLSIL